jgi:hypothetical protein
MMQKAITVRQPTVDGLVCVTQILGGPAAQRETLLSPADDQPSR